MKGMDRVWCSVLCSVVGGHEVCCIGPTFGRVCVSVGEGIVMCCNCVLSLSPTHTHPHTQTLIHIHVAKTSDCVCISPMIPHPQLLPQRRTPVLSMAAAGRAV